MGGKHTEHEREAGFSISTYSQDLVEQNAEEHFGPRYGDPEYRALAMEAGFVDAEGEITPAGWEQLNDDISKLERNSLRWLAKKFNGARDEGHDSYDDLIGTFWYDPKDLDQAEHIQMGVSERIDMVDTSFGDLGDTAFDGVSDFGASVLGGSISFFDIDTEKADELEATVERARKRASKRSRKSR